MAIKGLSDRGMAFPEIGHIRKGAPKPEDGKRPGGDLTFFRVEFDDRETEAAAKFLKCYGNEPREINILLPFDEIERMWDPFLEAYTAGRMVARSDGEKFIYLVNPKTGEIEVKNGQPFKAYEEGKPIGYYTNQKTNKDEPIYCKPTGRLKVVIPELQRLAYLVVLTTSFHDIVNISSQLEALKQVNGGRLAGIPMVLRRRPKKISTPKADGTKARYAKWLISIEADPEWVKRMLVEVKNLALPGNGLDLLPAGEVIDVNAKDEPLEETQDYEDEEDIPSDPDMEEGQFQDELFDEPISRISLETAKNIVDSKGMKYGDCPTENLEKKLIGIDKGLEKPDLTQEQRESYLMKKDAIAVIVESRKKG